MTAPSEHEEMREVAREVLRELVPGILAEALGNAAPNGNGNGNGNGHAAPAEDGEVVPVVPAPPVAAVLRPSTWAAPAAPGEVIGDRAPATDAANGHAPDGSVEQVTIDTDEDLERFVRSLLSRLESPRDRRAIRSGRLRFTLRRSAQTAPAGDAGAPALRIAKGAVTERTVREAAEKGARLVLARGAVLTPLARDQSRALGVTIEREGKC